jgi:hypothetical protein
VELLGICKGRSEAVILPPERVLIPVTCPFCHSFGIMGDKAGRVPLLHLNHGVIVVGQSLFGSKRVYPAVDSPPVISQKLVEICIYHVQ